LISGKREYMGKHKSLTREAFIRIVAGSGLGFMAWIWYRLSDNGSQQYNATEFRHAIVPSGVSFFGKYYLHRKENSVTAYSATCTHAGCRLLSTKAEIIHCGCHGSRFDAGTGMPLKGPAIHPLEKLECNYHAESGEWIVKFKSPVYSKI
jgi:Rieske Fe-S protein